MVLFFLYKGQRNMNKAILMNNNELKYVIKISLGLKINMEMVCVSMYENICVMPTAVDT